MEFRDWWAQRPPDIHAQRRQALVLYEGNAREKQGQQTKRTYVEYEVHTTPPRRRWGYEQVIVTDTLPGQAESRGWEGLDMVFARGCIKLFQKSPFVAGMAFAVALTWGVYMTLHLGWGITLRQDKQAGLFSYDNRLTGTMQYKDYVPQGRILPLHKPQPDKP